MLDLTTARADTLPDVMLLDGTGLAAAPPATRFILRGLEGVAAAFEVLGDPERHAKILIDPASQVSGVA